MSTDTSYADAATAVERPHAPDLCPNCGGALHGPYCSTCGQRDQPIRQPVGRFLQEALIEFFGVDGRAWSSLHLLLFKPGRLTKAYLAGQRVRYLRPLRLYLIASLLFFFLLSMLDPVGGSPFFRHDALDEGSPETMSAGAYRQVLDSLGAAQAEQVSVHRTVLDSLAAALVQDSLSGEGRRDALAEAREDLDEARHDATRGDRQRAWVRAQIASAPADSIVRPADLTTAYELLHVAPDEGSVQIDLPAWLPQSESVRQLRTARTGQEIRSAFASFFRDVLRRLPTVMFVLLPAFAFLLKGLYLRRRWYYSEHLVFALHTHAFAFAMFSIVLLLANLGGETAWSALTANLIVLLIPVYFYVAQKRVYGQGWIKTAIKTWILGWLYMMVLTAGLLLAVMLAAML